MKSANTLKFAYIPEKITVGQAANGFTAFVTCKWQHEKWMNPSVFERICGYKPYSQRDSVKQLKKIITNSVVTIDNTPTSGFKLVDANNDIYKLNRRYSDRGDVILQDPRGFNIGIPEDDFWQLFASIGYNIENAVLHGSFAYIWKNENCRFSLINASTDEYKCVVSNSIIATKKKDDTKYLTASQLEIGKAYLTADNLNVVYLGKHDTYSSTCHLDAYDRRSYRVELFANDRTDSTGIGKHVFFVLGVKIDKYCTYILDNNASYRYGCDPYIAKKSISKYILKKLSDDVLSKHTMYNTDVIATYDNIVDDMNHSLFFNKLDLSRCESCNELLSIEHFMSEYGYDGKYVFASFPFKSWDRAACIYTHKFGCASINALDASNGRYNYTIEADTLGSDFSHYNYTGHNIRYENMTAEELYYKVEPFVNIFYLENGNKVDQFAARCFMPKDKRSKW